MLCSSLNFVVSYKIGGRITLCKKLELTVIAMYVCNILYRKELK